MVTGHFYRMVNKRKIRTLLLSLHHRVSWFLFRVNAKTILVTVSTFTTFKKQVKVKNSGSA